MSSGLRQSKKLKAKQELEKRAFELFNQKGFEATTVEEIAVAAAMSPRTFFRYFSSKEDVIFQRSEDQLLVMKRVLTEHAATERGFAGIRSAMLAFAGHLEERRESLQRIGAIIWASPTLRAKLRDRRAVYCEVAAQTIAAKEGAPRPTLRHLILASVGITVLEEAAYAWSKDKDAMPLARVVEQAFDMLEDEIDSSAAGERRPPKRG